MTHLRTISYTDEISKVGASTCLQTKNKMSSQRSDCSEHTATDFTHRLKSATCKVQRDAGNGAYLYRCLETAAPWLPSIKDSEYYFLYPKGTSIASSIIGILIMVIRSSSHNVLQDVNLLRSISYEIVTKLERCNKGKRTTAPPGDSTNGHEHQSEINIGFGESFKTYTNSMGPFSCLDSDISAFCSLLSTTTTHYKKLSNISMEDAVLHSIKNLSLACSASYDDETKAVVQTDLLRSYLFNISTPRFPCGRQGMVAYTLVNDLSFRVYGRYACQIYLRRVLLISATLFCTPTFEFCDPKHFSSHRPNKVTALAPDVIVKILHPFVFSTNDPFPWSTSTNASTASVGVPESILLSPETLSTYFNVPLHTEYHPYGQVADMKVQAEGYYKVMGDIFGQEGVIQPERILRNIDHTQVTSKSTSFIPGSRIIGDQSDSHRMASMMHENSPQTLLAPMLDFRPANGRCSSIKGGLKGGLVSSTPNLLCENGGRNIKCDLVDTYDYNKHPTLDKLFIVSNVNTYANENESGDFSELSRSDSPIPQGKRPMTAFTRSKPRITFGKTFKKKDEVKEDALPPFLSVAATKDGLKHEPKLAVPATCNGNETYKRITIDIKCAGSPINYTKTLESFSTSQGLGKAFSNRGPDGEDKFYHLKFKCGDGSILMFVEFLKEYGGTTEGHVILGQSHFQWDVTVIAGPQVLDFLVGGKYINSVYLSTVGNYTVCFKLLEKGAWIDLLQSYDVFARVL